MSARSSTLTTCVIQFVRRALGRASARRKRCPHFIAISVVALTEADLPTLASLIVASSLFQFAMAAWLPFLRRIVTPIVSGTALMLIAVAVMPIAVGRLTDVPAGAPEAGGLIVAGVTLAVATGMVLRASGVWRSP